MSIFVHDIIYFTGIDGHYIVTITSNPVGTPVRGSINTFNYPLLSSVTLRCSVSPSATTTSYQWNTGGCYTNRNYNGGAPRCFPRGKRTQTVTGNDLNAKDAGTITCTAIINGIRYHSQPFTLRISGKLCKEIGMYICQ